MENFNLKKFLVENKLTANSRMISENTDKVEYKGYIIKLNDYNYGNKPGTKYEFYNTNDPDQSMGHGSSVEDCKKQIDSEMINENTLGRQEVYYDDALFEIQAKYSNLETAIQGVKEYLDGGNGVVTFDTWEKAEVPHLEFDGPCYFLVGPDEEPGQHPPLLVSVRDGDLITDPKIVAQYKAEDAERM